MSDDNDDRKRARGDQHYTERKLQHRQIWHAQAAHHFLHRAVHEFVGDVGLAKLEAVLQHGKLRSMFAQPAGKFLGPLAETQARRMTR